MKKHTLILAGLIISATHLQAQNTGGAFGPVVNEGHRALQYRGTYDPEKSGFAQRLHYEQALDTDFMWRAVVGTRKTNDSDVDFDFFQAELFWELTPDETAAWKTGVRFDLTLRDDDRPHSFGVHWMNEYRFDDGWTGRFLILSAIDFGDNVRDGLSLQTRASLLKKLNDKVSVGAELYSAYGRSNNLLGLDDQRHQLGPVVTYNLSDDLQLYSGVLFGLTDVNSDPQFRLWLTQKF